MMMNIKKDELFPLSLSQLNILNLERALSGTSVNNISTTVRIRGRVDFVALQKSINLVIESDMSLRTQLITAENGEILQYHAAYKEEVFPVYDFTNTSEDGIANWEQAVTRELIQLENSPLYRFVLFRDSENSGGILVKLHHIIADGWTQIMLCNKIGKTYLELLSGNFTEIEPAPDYRLHIEEEREYISSKAFDRDRKYWQDIVSKIGQPCSLKNVSGAAVSPVGRRMSFELPQIINHAIYSFCEEKRVAPFAVFYMALAIYFKRNGYADNFTVGVPIFNRTNYEFKQSTGMFVTTLPFYNEINDEWTLNSFNEDLMEKWYDMLRHQRYPFSKICQLSKNDGRLFNIALSYQDSKIYESRDASVHLSGRWHYCGYQAEQLTIHLTNLKDHQQYAVDYDYLAQYFTENEIETLHKNLCHILNEALCNPDRPIHELNILSLEEKEQVLYTFNKTQKYLAPRSVYETFIKNNRKHPSRVAIIHNGQRMTYEALLHRSTQYACAIGNSISGAGKLIAIMLPKGFDLPAAMVAVLRLHHAYLLISDTLPAQRIKTILEQSETALIITDKSSSRKLGDCDLPVITPDIVDETYGIPLPYEENAEVSVGDMLAYVVYTSGSTGEPKGVEITQSNLLNLAQEMESVYGNGAVLSVCNIGFDAFMLESIVALLNGRTIVFPDDSDLESPERLATLMNGYAVGFFAITPSRLNVLLANETFCKVLWRMESIVCGGEHFPTELLKKLKLYTNARIYNQYGPSETTVAVSMKELSHADKITIGSPMGNCRMYVLDQWLNPLPIGGSGRLYVGGKCVGNGYRKRPDLTENAFRANPFVSNDRIYDTGDIAKWTANGEIILTGRADSQVKLRGLRIELQEISSCIESYENVATAHAKICHINGTDVLGVYYTSSREIGEHELIAHAATYLPSYMIPTFALRVPSIPMTVNGKVNEAALPLPMLSEDAPAGDVSQDAERILAIFRKVLNSDTMSASGDYFRNGGNSLNAMQCVMEIEEQFGKKIRVADLYVCRTAIKLAAFINGDASSFTLAVTEPKKRVNVTQKKTQYPLSAIQQGIYVQSMLDSTGCAYNMPGAFKLENKPDIDLLTYAFVTLIKEDAIFRTAFVQQQDGIVACIYGSVDFEIETIEADSFEAACSAFVRPFALEKAPLLRAGLWRSVEDDWYLFIDSHHIIGDGMSTPVILARLDRAYRSQKTDMIYDYYDYMSSVEESAEEKKASLNYWKQHLEHLPEALQLCGDYPRAKNFDYQGDACCVSLEKQVYEACKKYCEENGVSEFAVVTAAYVLLLSAVSGKNDMVIGTPISSRDLVGSENICGPFINTLPLRLKPEGNNTVKQWLQAVAGEITALLDHRNVSLEEIISALELPRGEQNALYSVMITQSPVEAASLTVFGEHTKYTPVITPCVKMDLIMELAHSEDTLDLSFTYADKIFKRETIAFYGRCIANIVGEFLKDDRRKLSDIRLMTIADQDMLIDTPRDSVTPFVNMPIHRILRNTASRKENEAAVIYHNEKISFAMLEKRAAAVADFIEAKGVEKGSCIALCMKRTPDMIAAMYGVLKAGCAYMFVLDSFPAARIQYMLTVSSAALMLYDENVTLPDLSYSCETGCEICTLPVGESTDERSIAVNDDDIANVLFTSGSTGQPKGVMLRHRSVANLYAQMKTMLDPIEGTVLCSTNAIFDCFIVETLIALALGRTVVLADEEEMMLPWRLAELMEKYDTGIFEMTPTRFDMCLNNEAFCRAAKHIRIVLLGGEVVTDRLVDKFYKCSDGVLMNMYGPTEATVFTTCAPLYKGEHITIGRPLQNTRTYVLDENRKPVLPTACGEMYIAGECLAGGYIGREDLTERMFVEDVLFPGQKMYRSGDIVRMRMDGSYDYIGRLDTQVKLNGQRVELDEICRVIETVSSDLKAAVAAIRKNDETMELCAFYVTENQEITAKRIYDEIEKVLPKYMVPSAMIRLEKMPLTATNKIDRVTLMEYARNRSENSFESHENDSQDNNVMKNQLPVEDNHSPVVASCEYVMSVWNSVLSVPVSSEESSFFACGGTSMGALSVLSRYYTDKFEMSLGQFYENLTVKQQASLLAAQMVDEQEKNQVDFVDDHNNDLRSVLVTGATGFFGSHLVKQLLDADQDVICLVRNGGSERLSETMRYYFGDQATIQLMDRIRVVDGDISKENFGMFDADYERLCQEVGQIYHSAADVRHYATDSNAFMKTNVGGTENVIRFANEAHAKLYHISTCSVSGSMLKQRSCHAVEFTENDFDIGQVWENNIYVKSKYLAEKAVLEAMKNGLEAKIFRLGRLVGRECDGKFQPNFKTNAFYLTLQGLLAIGAIPVEIAETPIDLVPVDRGAEQVVLLSNGKEDVYHIMDPLPTTFLQIMKSLNADIQVVSMADFFGILKKKAPYVDRALCGVVVDSIRSNALSAQITVTCEKTTKALIEFGYYPSVVNVDMVLREFKKGE